MLIHCCFFFKIHDSQSWMINITDTDHIYTYDICTRLNRNLMAVSDLTSDLHISEFGFDFDFIRNNKFIKLINKCRQIHIHKHCNRFTDLQRINQRPSLVRPSH